MKPLTSIPTLIALALLSLAMIAYQLSLMQLLSIVQWYHFAYMVISIALLGFGAAGSVLALFREPLLRRAEMLIPLLMGLAGVSMPLAVWLSGMQFARFDTYLLFVERRQAGQLLIQYVLFILPFFCCALAIGLLFVRDVKNIGRLYFSNLTGSGLGGIAAIGMFWILLPVQVAFLTGVLAIVAALFALPRYRWLPVGTGVLAALVIVLTGLYSPPELHLSQYKGLSRTMNLPDVAIVASQNSPYGYVQHVTSPALRYAPGLSLAYADAVPVVDALFNNGDWYGPMLPPSDPADTAHILDFTTSALPWAIADARNVLILDAGTGVRTSHAASRGAGNVHAVEPHRVIHAFEPELQNGAIVEHFVSDGRSFLAQTQEIYDLISLPPAGAFGGSAGLQALREEYLMTNDAFGLLFDKLGDDGILEITTWVDYPYRYPLRIAATIAEVLEEKGIADPLAHVVAIRSWSAITFIVRKSPLTTEDTDAVRTLCARLYFDPLLLPGITEEERMAWHQLEDQTLFSLIDTIFTGDRDVLYTAYDFHVWPVTDDRPYFSQFLRWRSIQQMRSLFGDQSASFLELGYLIVLVTLAQSLLLAVVLIMLPLLRLGWRGGDKRFTVLYFAGIGIGYMFVEIVLIQRFILFLGNPVYSIAAVIGGMLILSGVGSYLSSGLTAGTMMLRRIAVAIVAILLLYALVLTPVLQVALGMSLPLRILIALVLIGIPAVLMGMPFPLGLRYLSQRSEAGVPWAWGINGSLSVVSAVLATIIALEMGFTALMLLATAAYVVVVISVARR